MHKVPCTEDPNCNLLAQLLVPDIIISALKCIVDNHTVTVRTFESEKDKRTVVLFCMFWYSRFIVMK